MPTARRHPPDGRFDNVLTLLDRPIDSFGTDIISCMVRLNLVPSPHPEVVVSRYDEALFPEFRPLFEGTEAPRFLPPGFRHDPSQASTVVVLENRSEKAITRL